MNESCKNCGTILTGKYCSNCGQKWIHPGDRKLRHLGMEYIHHYTHVDGKFLSTLGKIFFKPGKVTRDVMHGITVPHFQLSALFLLGTIIYFLLPQSFIVSGSLNSDFKQQIEVSEFHAWKKQYADEKIKKDNSSWQSMASSYDHNQYTYGKLFTLLLIPLVIPVLWIINLVLKFFDRKHKIITYDLGIASLEINSILLYGIFLFGGLIIKLFSLMVPNENMVLITFTAVSAFIFVLLYFFFKRAYAVSWWKSLLCLGLLMLGYINIMSVYSFITFLVFT